MLRFRFLPSIWAVVSSMLLFTTAHAAHPDDTPRHDGIHDGMQGAMHFIESGKLKPAVVFIPGLTQTTAYWEEWVKLLGDCGIQALAVDLPGFGGSSQAAGPYTITGVADAVAKFIEARRLGAVTLIGNSMGSTVAQFVALNHPQLVQRLVLVATSSKSFVPPNIDASTSKPFIPETVEQTKQRWLQNPRAVVDGFFYAKQPPRSHAERFYAAFGQMNLDAGALISESNNHWSTYERLDQIAVPTLIVQGARDRSKSPEEAARMIARMPKARLVVLEHAAHTPQWDDPPAFNNAVLPFILEAAPKHIRCDASTFPLDREQQRPAHE